MRTGPVTLALLLCSGAALAQDPLGDDSGPNANNGQCDDTRFENIGAGNSNIVFWEGGRYDGRDASDCRDLLLRGLINWRDGVDPRLPVVLATGEFGDDSGPNANNGQCDDTRFENIGAGNSNIVFWEGGRYDGRDATDCADLLLQGLIAWRRDAAVAGVPAEPATSTVADARQQQSTALPEGVTAESICSVNLEAQACWMELDNVPGCYVWVARPQLNQTASLSGQCSEGFVNGTGTITWVWGNNGERTEVFGPGPFLNGRAHGHWVRNMGSGGITEGTFVQGRREGRWIWRTDDFVEETPYVNGEVHGTHVFRFANGNESETPYVNGVVHGTQVHRDEWGTLEIPIVNGVGHGTSVTRYANGNVRYTCWRDDEIIANEPC